jgi:tetratricopeptide (TPR) repeat protein
LQFRGYVAWLSGRGLVVLLRFARHRAVAVCALVFPLSVLASPESDALKRQWIAALEAQRYDDAFALFRKATRADPADRDALFYLAATYNRLGLHLDAYSRLRALDQAGYRNTELDFEAGWSLLGANRPQACIDRLERYERAVPGRALTSEFLGRCLLAAGRHTEAEAKLREALVRDPSSKQRIDVLLVQAQVARGNRQAASAQLTDIMREDTSVGRALRDADALLAPLTPPAGTGLRLAASAAIGHNSNVIGLGNTMPLPTDISKKSANLLRVGFGASYTAQFDEQTRGSVGYGFLAERFDGVSAGNSNDHYLYAEAARGLNNWVAVSLRGSVQVTELGGDHFRTQPAIRPAVAFRFTPSSVTEFSYFLGLPDYAPVSFQPFDRDGKLHAGTVSHVIEPADSSWSGSLSYSHTSNRTEGSDFASRGDVLAGAIRYAFTRRANLTVGASIARERYDNPNSLTGFTLARRDTPRGLFAQFTGPLTDHLRYYLQFQKSRSDSNIAFYDYEQRIVIGGIAADF